jgi:hypothetical protein
MVFSPFQAQDLLFITAQGTMAMAVAKAGSLASSVKEVVSVKNSLVLK